MKPSEQPTSKRILTGSLLPLLDAGLVLLAFVLAYFARYELQLIRAVLEFNQSAFEPYLPYAVIYIVWLYVNYRGMGLYKANRGRSWLDEVYTIINGVTNATVVTLALSFFLQPLVFSRLMMIYVAAITIVLLAIARGVIRIVRAHLRKQGIGVQRVMVIGAGEVGQSVMRVLVARRDMGYQLVAYVDTDPALASTDLGRVKGLGGITDLGTLLRDHAIDFVIITIPWRQNETIIDLISICQKEGVEVSIIPDVFQLNLRQVQVEALDGIPLLRMNAQLPFKGTSRVLKRLLDITLVVLASPVLLLILLFVWLAIKLEDGGTIFYTAERVGEHGKHFKMFKFRSMIPNADQMRAKLTEEHGDDPRRPKFKDDPRITRVGKFIRRTSIDELPNLINVMLGQMSLVGPRPPTPEEVALYDQWHMQRLAVKPGMTGLWQISGRSDIPFDEMCLLDIYYIENWSMGLDAQILMLTIPRVLLRQGVY